MYAVSVLKRCHVRLSVRTYVRLRGSEQRARQQQSRAAAGDAHRRLRIAQGRVHFGPTYLVETKYFGYSPLLEIACRTADG